MDRLNYDVVLLDADDTLLDFHRAEIAALEETLTSFGYNAPLDSYMERFREINTAVWKEYEQGRATSAEIRVRRFVQLLHELRIDAEPEEVSAYYVNRLGQAGYLLDGARELLETLYGRVPLALVTNGIGQVQRSRLARTGLTDFFDAIVISEEIGIQKPDPAAFHMALEAAGATAADRAIMIGDGLGSDIRGANAAGIDACWFNLRNKPLTDEAKPTYTITSLRQVYPILGLELPGT